MVLKYIVYTRGVLTDSKQVSSTLCVTSLALQSRLSRQLWDINLEDSLNRVGNLQTVLINLIHIHSCSQQTNLLSTLSLKNKIVLFIAKNQLALYLELVQQFISQTNQSKLIMLLEQVTITQVLQQQTVTPYLLMEMNISK